jgi:hyaluronoglucosaminidase
MVLLALVHAAAAFEAVWNGPWPQDCGNSTPGLDPSSFDLEKFGITANAGNAWWGSRIQCRYCGAPQDDAQCPGLWPYFVGDKAYHGGIPQAANLTAHAAKVAVDMERFLPEPGFDGLVAIDMENWYPFPLRSASKAYITASEAWVKRQHPSWGASAVAKQASAEWGTAAIEWWATVLRVTRAVRPKAKVGFYNFPSCYAGFSAASDPPGCTSIGR